MNVFNSLGSNYDLSFAIKVLLATGRNKDYKALSSLLEKRYGGKAVILQKGRQAITLALQTFNLPKDSLVGINGFTCFAVFQAIEDAGYKPFYFDIHDRSLNFSGETLSDRVPVGLRVLIIQNTLGIPCEIEKMKKFCVKNKICLIEDLAHSAGGSYADKKEVGRVGDFTVLSFGQDKIIDTVSGGALIIRNPKYRNRVNEENLPSLGFITQIRDRLYPILTYFIRATYCFGLGKFLHFVLKSVGIFSVSVSVGASEIRKLPNWYCRLVKFRLQKLESELAHRREIVQIYARELPKRFISQEFIDNIASSTNLRFPIFVKNRSKLVLFLEKKGIYISDIWYDSPVSPKKYLALTDYAKNACPNSEKISEQILNLPTHINVSKRDAEYISESVNLWLKSQ